MATVLIVDESPCVRSGLASWISNHPGLQVCAEASDALEAARLARRTRPDLVVLDVALGRGQGIELIEVITAMDQGSRVLVYSRNPEHLYAERALRAGAVGWVDKRARPATVMGAVMRVLDGKVHVSEEMASSILARALGRSRNVAGDPVCRLSNRELDIFRMIGRGASTRVVADRLGLSIHTVHSHREHIKRKLGYTDSCELVLAAVHWVIKDDID